MSLPRLAQLEFTAADLIASQSEAAVHATFDWDFEAGDFRLVDGRPVVLTGMAYLQVWIQKVLRTPKDTLIYDAYGSGHRSLIGQNLHPDYTQAELEREVREALLQNEAITGVHTFTFTQSSAGMHVTFIVESLYGSLTGEVKV
ncbi:DUF2634 domain-containing protein [Paenibacillus aurantiacus]|uniref:DUF2634 domain-containing protein n=1 Tax=Paenibacillus aurantiacus TaxID=1936118 RepID=A0ABV5KP93_9BACL